MCAFMHKVLDLFLLKCKTFVPFDYVEPSVCGKKNHCTDTQIFISVCILKIGHILKFDFYLVAIFTFNDIQFIYDSFYLKKWLISVFPGRIV